MSEPVRPAQVPPRRLESLLSRLPGASITGDQAVAVTGVTHDSRQVRPGDLYVARGGQHTHGIEHVAQAVAAGAGAVLTDPEAAPRAVDAGAAAVVVSPDPREAMGPAAAWVYGDPGGSLLVIGITGTNGKTTTAYLADAGLRAAGRRTGLIGTIETRIGDEVLPSARTTPEATDLHALLAVMRERGADAVTMEVSSHALALGRVAGLRFDVAGFTNLSQDHLDFHDDMADYFATKARLFTPQLAERGVVCIDDAWGHRLAAQSGIPVVTTGAVPEATWQRVEGEVSAAGGCGRLIGPEGTESEICCRLPGRVNLANAALAYVLLATAGIDPGSARRGIADLAAVPGRMERVDDGQPYLAFVDYAHTPDAVRRVLDEARGLLEPGGRVLVVLGCGGDRDREKRPMMAAAAADGADVAILTSDNPRSESPDAILSAMLAGVPPTAAVVVEPDREAAIRQAVQLVRPLDVIVVAGKGHEKVQETAAGTVPFDDRAVLRAAILDRRGGSS